VDGGHQSHGIQRMAAQIEEIGGYADPLVLQKILP
jgi:hypothetical protein